MKSREKQPQSLIEAISFFATESNLALLVMARIYLDHYLLDENQNNLDADIREKVVDFRTMLENLCTAMPYDRQQIQRRAANLHRLLTC